MRSDYNRPFDAKIIHMNKVAMGSTSAIFVTLFFLITGSTCLKMVKLNVPPYKMRGELAILECIYELDARSSESLYAVKWYKENEEFFRYVPKADPKIGSYRVEGIKVDHTLSDSKQVALRGVNLKSSGVYKCEVSAEAPSFASASREARMEVIFLPNHGPHISNGNGKQYYMIGDEINLNCTSAKSYPASILHWFINDQQVTDGGGIVRYPHVTHPHGLVTTILGLRTTVAPQHFIGGSMKLKCVASLSPVLWQGEGESIVQSMSPLLDNREAMLLVKGEARANAVSITMLLTSVLLALFRS